MNYLKLLIVALAGTLFLSSCASAPDEFDKAIDAYCTGRVMQKAQTPPTK